MKLFKLYAIESPGWDCNNGFIVRAENEMAARELANAEISDERYESKAFWLDYKLSTCVEVSAEGEAEIILNDFNAG